MESEALISTLNDLIETCKDGEYGFHACAEQVDAIDLETLFERRAAQCRDAARELQDAVVRLGGKPDSGGTTAGALHRGWVALRSKLARFDDLAVVKECERGEVVTVAHYRAALDSPLPSSIRDLVERQFEGVRRNHDQIRELRDSLQMSS
jgi:uncharacterized protein (TIGR02284 family)